YAFSSKSGMLLSISQAIILPGVCFKTLRRWDAKGLLCPDCRMPRKTSPLCSRSGSVCIIGSGAGN
ncbi:MAG: hypothetical protein ACFFD2_08545, partial [Promethearchaeota archaeon]